jgi:hypothetical protein
MVKRWMPTLIFGGIIVFASGGCTVQQQQEVLGTIGKVIPGSSNSIYSSSSSTPVHTPLPSSASEQAAALQPQATAASPLPVDIDKIDAQWVLRTMQKAMTANPSPFQECLDDPPCKLAFTAHLIRLQKQAGGTLDLPPVYDRYDLKRGQ